MEFNERLDKIWDRISDAGISWQTEELLMRFRYYVFDYDPHVMN
jgi:hypothetical protein